MSDVIDLTTSDSEESSIASSDDETRSESSTGSSQSSSSNAAPTSLEKALYSVSESRLRAVASELAAKIPAANLFLEQKLLVKRSAPRWENCLKCGEEFDMEEERASDIEPDDEEGFVDWDENCHGPMDTPANRKQYPENFIWTCCQEVSLADGCVQGVHSGSKARKRARR
ncbi:hypothetical protein OE88DRAFT_1812118 [Heliocybe sulcata]|uniref:Uncharacterized protein n=1 Tax=Heliocybe sulcata TaxID=5364 RepID=A0A5C3MXB3_9AGAM|nr:hypothetical protein OE88DRAFT_1812118 [Heliocybe sulcata]